MPTKKFNVRRLVSNRPGDAAKQDINLVNAWGLINDRDTFWVADNETGVLTHYDINGNKLSPEVVHLINSTGFLSLMIHPRELFLIDHKVSL